MIWDFLRAMAVLALVAIAFNCFAQAAICIIKKAKKKYPFSIPPYIMGKPEVTFSGPLRNRMKHVLSF